MPKNKKLIGLIPIMLAVIVLIIFIGPADGFKHGYYSEEMPIWDLPWQNYLEGISLDTSYGEIDFSPVKDHFAGFEIVITKSEGADNGNLYLKISDEKGKLIETQIIDTNEMRSSEWYKVKTSAALKKGSRYHLEISSDAGSSVPNLICMTSDYLPAETVEGNILINYAYAEPVFSPEKKTLLIMVIISLCAFVCSFFFEEKIKRALRIGTGVLLMTALLSWNYLYNIFDVQNDKFVNFQDDSEILVTGVIYADRDGVYFSEPEEKGYGLGYYRNVRGRLFNYREWEYTSDSECEEGYSKSGCGIKVVSNDYTKDVIAPGNIIRFANGESFEIESISDDDTSIFVTLKGDSHLSVRRNGSLDDAEFYSPSGEKLESGRIIAYLSQFGLQGKIFKVIARMTDRDDILPPLNLITSIAMAVTVILITWLLLKKYNPVMAGCFLVTFALSPWTVNFARNLYWVEFTWFLPMAAGIFCAWKIENKKCRIAGYVLSFLTILIKSLCGYEYITAVMLGLILFPAADLFIALASRKKEKAILLLKAVLITGCAALAGFMAAVVIHSRLGNSTDIISGIKRIILEVALRRTAGADLNKEAPVIWGSLNASVWDTIAKYFGFSTQIIPGVNGNLFPALCIVPICFFAYDLKKKKADHESLFLYLVSFITSLSWFVFGKSHSYVHTQINFVIWYFGFIQICFYIIINRLVKAIKGAK